VLDFQRTPSTSYSPGMVLRTDPTGNRYLRLTHVFEHHVYYVWVTTEQNARYARRPYRMLRSKLDELSSSPGATWGHLSLPAVISSGSIEDREDDLRLESLWNLIKPLIEAFNKESNLSSNTFRALIRKRAVDTDSPEITIWRLITRYYYFGGSRLALLPLVPGRKPSSRQHGALPADKLLSQSTRTRRTGRPAILESIIGVNTFIVHDSDINSMVECLKSCLRRGPTYLTHAHEEYLKLYFSVDHPDLYQSYLSGSHVEPVTLRQFKYYVSNYALLEEVLSKNLRTRNRDNEHVGNLYAAGPGDIYEIDATGGRLFLVSSTDPPTLVGKPTIYLMIDRWSRFVVSAYITLGEASYEEVRHALLIAFTSRNLRFQSLGIDIDDLRWPVGKMPSQLCTDRGSEFMSESMRQSVSHDLRIDLLTLPPYCPDGKAIIERFIREVKRRMASSGLKGTYSDRPMDPDTKDDRDKAESAAVHTLSEAYRVLLEIIVDHNTRPHRTLREIQRLVQAGVEPTPQAAYFWGVHNLTELHSPPFTDDDYRRLLLPTDTASIGNRCLKYKGRTYLPVNERAYEMAIRSTLRAKKAAVRLDKTSPFTIWVPTLSGLWAEFGINEAGRNQLKGLTLQEAEALSGTEALLWAKSENKSRIDRLTTKKLSKKRAQKIRESVVILERSSKTQARIIETAEMKEQIGTNVPQPSLVEESSALRLGSTLEAIEESERRKKLDAIRQHRSNRG